VVTDFSGTIRRVVRAGDDAYDVVLPHLVEVAPLALDGSLMDIFQLTVLDFDKPWWNSNTIRDLSIGNRLFVMQGDLLIMDNDAMEAMIFNKAILRDHGLDSPYDIVRSGEWTFDKLIQMSRGVSRDLNGDGRMFIQDDRFGVILQSDTDLSFLVSGGEKVASKDANDLPIITFNTERAFKIMEAVSNLMLDEDNVVQLHRYYGQFGIYDEQVKMMEEDRALFSWIRMRVVERLRGMETDFGIIPLPKLDKEQPNYITHMNPHTGAGISIPKTASNLERTGMILEDLSAESRYTLRPAYYELNLEGKFMRDEESREMLDIILANTAYDIGYIYDFGGFAMAVIHYGRDKRTEYASTFERMEARMLSDIDRTIAAYENIE
jgi:ABC-type glycerol-3-phosphate transport system substrate-binding protein